MRQVTPDFGAPQGVGEYASGPVFRDRPGGVTPNIRIWPVTNDLRNGGECLEMTK